MKRVSALFLALTLMLTLSPAFAADTSGKFSDVPETAWYAPYVQVCADAGLMKGTGANAFSPDHYVTLAECHVMAARLHSLLTGGNGTLGQVSDAGSQYNIPPGAWYGDSVRYLSALPGASSVVYPGDYDTPGIRLQFLALLILAVPDDQLTPINQIESFPDADDHCLHMANAIPLLSVQDVLRFYNAGILAGTDSQGTFSSGNKLTRAEAAAMLSRILTPDLRLHFSSDTQPLPDVFAGLPGTVRPATEEEIAARPSDMPPFGTSRDFFEGYAVVGGELYQLDSGEWDLTKKGMVDTEGNLVIPQIYTYLEPFNSGMAAFGRVDAALGGILGCLTPDGTEYPFDCGRPGSPPNFSHGYANFYAKARRGDEAGFTWKEGLVDTKLNVVVPAIFDTCDALSGTDILLRHEDNYYLLTLENS